MAEAHKIEYDLMSEFRVLYVEDDESLRENTVEFLRHYFGHVEVARDGAEGLELYDKESYDLVISDIKMPKCDGLEMVQAIKAKSPQQSIVITSAYGDEEKLVKMIELGVTRFVSKPIVQKTFLKTLLDVCAEIDVKHVREMYVAKLVQTNNELQQKTEALEKKNAEYVRSLRILETKIQQLNVATKEKTETAPQGQEASKTAEKKPTESYFKHIAHDDADELRELEGDIDYTISTAFIRKTITHDDLEKLADRFDKYGRIINQYFVFNELSQGILDLVGTIQGKKNEAEEKFESIVTYLESLIFVLMRWRMEVIDKEAKDPNFFDASILNDIQMVIDFLEEREGRSGGIEFF